MSKPLQLAFNNVLDHSFRQRSKAIGVYMAANREKYIAFAEAIQPNLSKDKDIFGRIAFAILSANTPFEASVKALGYTLEQWDRGRHIEWEELTTFGAFVPNKVKWINTLMDSDLRDYRHRPAESWNDYRLRLKEIKGLGLTKASFAACMLYPLQADLACVDTWIQKVFLGNEGFRQLRIKDYLAVEAKVRRFGRTFNVSTFLAQWMIWDHARGQSNNHAIFPGSHKGG